jgi:acetyl-CoA acetyltransferase
VAAVVDETRRACIVGVGQTEYVKRGGSAESEYRLALRAITAAVAEAGLTPADVDGLSTFSDERSGQWTLAGDLGLRQLRFATTTAIPGGGGSASAVAEAALAVESGLADVVVVYRSLCQGQFARIGRALAPDGVLDTPPSLTETALETEALQAFTAPFGVLGPSIMFALPMRRHMERWGTTVEHLGQVAVSVRGHANRNPRALMASRPLTLADHQASRLVADPYRLFDCCLETDGACAVVVTSADRAADLAHRPVTVLASAQGTDGAHLGPAMLNAGTTADDYDTGGGRSVARQLYARAGLTPADVDVAQLYDNFSGQVLFGLEDFGLCERGASGPFVASGALDLGGAIPTNTAGGNLSEAYMQGLNHVIEGVHQLRGQSTSQVEGAEVCLVTSSPGIPTSAILLGRS